MSSINLLDVNIDSLTKEELNQRVARLARTDSKSMVTHVNIHGINMAYKHKWYKDFLNRAAINFCDGDGVRLIARIVDKHIKEKITYNRWIWDLAELSEREGFSWFMLGAREKSIAKAAEVLKQKYPALNIKGYRNGYIDNEQDLDKAIEQIKHCSPDLLIVGMGMPLQEKFLRENRNKLSFKVAFTAGAVFDYVSGEAAMTPGIFYKFKLEWFYRLLQEPQRLARRYLVGNLVFLGRVFKDEFL